MDIRGENLDGNANVLPKSALTDFNIQTTSSSHTRIFHPDPYLTINFVNLNLDSGKWGSTPYFLGTNAPLLLSHRRMRCQGLRRFNGGGTPGAREGGAVLDQDEKPDVCSSPFELLKQKNIYLVVHTMMLLLLLLRQCLEKSQESDSTAKMKKERISFFILLFVYNFDFNT